MKTLYFDCSMGAAGDMLTAALLELLPDPEAFLKKINTIGLPGVKITKESMTKCGILGTHMHVQIHGLEECEKMHHHEHGHPHEHTHHHGHPEHEGNTHHHDHDEHTHTHHHTNLHEIEHIASHLILSDKVKQDIVSVYRIIAEAESHAHGVPVTQIHFHEVGNLDAIADVAAVCMLMDEIAPDEVVVSPIHVGSGYVKCAHGILPVPAPATAYILRDVPIYGGKIKSELCTPTGAALLKYFATRFDDMPVMKTQSIGYGMGKKDFEIANCVRVFLGETEGCTDMIWELSCNLDDMTGEAIGFTMERLLEEGALDVYTIPIGMKKSRPAIMLQVLCTEEKKERMIHLLFQHTTTLGIRENKMQRYVLNRTLTSLDTPYGMIRKKEASGYGVCRYKYEYDDLAKAARENNISIQEIKASLDLFTHL